VDAGSDHFRAGRYQEAISEFREALAVLHNPGLVWNIARAYEELGDVRNALHYFEDFLKRYPKDKSVAEAQKRIAALRPKLPGWIVVDCGDYAGARVVVDGADPVPCGSRLGPLAPGLHMVEVDGRWKAKLAKEVRVQPEQETTVSVAVEIEAAAARPAESPEPVELEPDPQPPPPEPRPVPPPPQASEGGSRGLAWTATGAAVVLAGVAVVAAFQSQAARDDAVDAKAGAEAADAASDAAALAAALVRFEEADDSQASWNVTGYLSGGLALAAAGAAVYLWLDDGSAVEARFAPLPGGGVVTFAGSTP